MSQIMCQFWLFFRFGLPICLKQFFGFGLSITFGLVIRFRALVRCSPGALYQFQTVSFECFNSSELFACFRLRSPVLGCFLFYNVYQLQEWLHHLYGWGKGLHPSVNRSPLVLVATCLPVPAFFFLLWVMFICGLLVIISSDVRSIRECSWVLSYLPGVRCVLVLDCVPVYRFWAA